jgi:hypothetical protein
MPYGTGWSTDSTAPISPRSILNTSAICHVHGTLGPDTTLRPIGECSVPRVAGRVVEERERRNAKPCSASTSTNRRIANPRDVVEDARAELLEARALGGTRRR